jgi:hypothetical protein
MEWISSLSGTVIVFINNPGWWREDFQNTGKPFHLDSTGDSRKLHCMFIIQPCLSNFQDHMCYNKIKLILGIYLAIKQY